MGKIMCPGQDTAFWRPGDIFEVPCSECGHEVEFFKDDATRRCTRCGQLVRNPKLNLGCAQWCEHAKECLGYDPKEVLAQAEGGESSLVDRLIAAVKGHYKSDQAQITAALTVLEWAKKIMIAEGGDPRIILPAAVLHGLDPALAATVLSETGLEAASREEVVKIIGAQKAGEKPAGQEAKVVWDATGLASLQGKTDREASHGPSYDFLTAAGKEIARQPQG